MFFKIKKKVGTRPTKFVDFVRSAELCVVHPWWKWEVRPDECPECDHEVNYFVYTLLDNHDLYCYIDQEFLDVYRKKGLANNLENIINLEISKMFPNLGEYKPRYNLFTIVDQINNEEGGLARMKIVDLRKMMRHIATIRKDALSQRRACLYRDQMDYLRSKGLYFYAAGEDIYRMMDSAGNMVKLTIWESVDREPVDDKSIIKAVKAAYEKDEEIKKLEKDRIEKEKKILELQKKQETDPSVVIPEKPKPVELKLTNDEASLLCHYATVKDPDGNIKGVDKLVTHKHHSIECATLLRDHIADSISASINDTKIVEDRIEDMIEAAKIAERERYMRGYRS